MEYRRKRRNDERRHVWQSFTDDCCLRQQRAITTKPFPCWKRRSIRWRTNFLVSLLIPQARNQTDGSIPRPRNSNVRRRGTPEFAAIVSDGTSRTLAETALSRYGMFVRTRSYSP